MLNDVYMWLFDIFWITSLPFLVCVVCLFLSAMIMLYTGADNVTDGVVEDALE